MRMFRTPDPEPVVADDGAEPAEAIAGDRGIPQVNRGPSIQSRLSSFLAMGLMCALGVGFLTWYYARTLARPAQAHQAAQSAAKSHAQGEMTLPSLGTDRGSADCSLGSSDAKERSPCVRASHRARAAAAGNAAMPTAMPMPVGAAAPPPQKSSMGARDGTTPGRSGICEGRGGLRRGSGQRWCRVGHAGGKRQWCKRRRQSIRSRPC